MSALRYACPRCLCQKLVLAAANAPIQCLDCRFGFYLDEAIEVLLPQQAEDER